MSLRFWIVGGGFVAGGLLAGASLGGFAAGHSQGGLWGDHWAAADEVAAVPQNMMYGGDYKPRAEVEEKLEQIVCKGCGPTLAERQMAADAYAADGVDPYLRDYARSETDEPRLTEAEQMPPQPVAAAVKVPPADLLPKGEQVGVTQ